MTHLLGIDLGTSSVKVVLTDDHGQILGSGNADYPIHQPRAGWAEQDPGEWWQATKLAVRLALADADSSMEIKAIGLSGQMHGTVLLDRYNQPIAPAVIWPDQRTQQQVQEITELIGAERLIDLTGSPIATGFQAATVRWFQQKRKDIWRQARQIILPKDHLRWRLTRLHDTEPSDASSTLLLNIQSRGWSQQILKALSIDQRILPPVQKSISIAGELQANVAEEIGLPPGVPITTGAGDTASSMLGAGVTTPECLLLNISSGGQLILPIFELQVDKTGRTHTFCSALEPGANRAGWYKLGGILAAGLALNWLREKVLGLQGENVYQQMTHWAEDVPAGSRGLIFLPHLIGERTPYMNPLARGMFLGLTLKHGKSEMVRAVMEGVSMQCYEAYSALIGSSEPPKQIVLAGGGARSMLWQQIMADVFGLPVRRLKVVEQSAVGAALLAGASIGLFDACTAAREWASYGPPIEPNLQNHALYQEMIVLFRKTYLTHVDDFSQGDINL